MEHVLFVCTGNLCRSPMAEALLRRRLDERGVDAVAVTSAGTHASAGAATEIAATVAAEMGGTLRGHRATRVERGLLESADLTVAMTAGHVTDLVQEAPDLADRVFKLSELARLAGEHEPRGRGESLTDYVVRIGAGRSERPWIQSRTDADVVDPIGEGSTFYRRVAEQIDGLLAEIASRVWPDGPEQDAHGGRADRGPGDAP